MSVEEARLIYKSLLDNSELDMLLPGAIGEWEQDKNAFLNVYKKNQEAINLLSLELDLDSEDFEDL